MARDRLPLLVDSVPRPRGRARRRHGKRVTVVDGLPDNDELLAGLAKEWKKACGTGGTAGKGWVELQGDQRERLREIVSKRGWKVKG